MIKKQFQKPASGHTGCPHPGQNTTEDREAMRQSYTEGGERVPADLLYM